MTTLADCQFVTYRSPLSPDLVGAAVFREDRVLGTAWDFSAATAKHRAVGEAVERTALKHDGRQFEVHTALELGDRALLLNDSVRFSAKQVAAESLARYRWTAETPTSWTEALRLEAPDERVLVPADLVFFRQGSADAALLRPVSSTGTAAHPSRDQALLRALVECVERHGIAVAHRQGNAAARVNVAEFPELCAIAGLLEAADVRLEIGLLSVSFGIPVVVAAVISSQAGRPSIAMGSAAGPKIAAAGVAATLEAIQVFHLAWQMLRRGAVVAEAPRTSNERALWWGTRPAAFAERLFRNASPVRLRAAIEENATTSTPMAVVERLVAHLGRSGHTGAFLDITPTGPQPLGTHVMRVVLPSLLLPHTDERYPFMTTPCLPDIPVNPSPHPFA